jgi:hypothetical protein
VIPPGVEKVEAAPGLNGDAFLLQPPPNCLLVVDNEADMPVRVLRLRAARSERKELIAHVEERHAGAPASEPEVEDSRVKVDGLADVTDLERNMVDSDEPRCHGQVSGPGVLPP